MDLSAYLSLSGLAAIIAGGCAASLWEFVPLRPMSRLPFFAWSAIVSLIGIGFTWGMADADGLIAAFGRTLVIFITSFVVTDLGQRRTADVVGRNRAIAGGWINLVPVVNLALLFLPGKPAPRDRQVKSTIAKKDADL